jgi:hypothetical protein
MQHFLTALPCFIRVCCQHVLPTWLTTAFSLATPCPAAGQPASSVYSDAADTVATPMGQTATGNVLNNANLPQGVTAASVTGFSIEGSSQIIPAGSNAVRLTDPDTGAFIGTFTLQPSGAYTFVPQPGYVGPAPAVNVYSRATNGQTAVSSITLDVVPGEEEAVTMHIASIYFGS